MKNRKREICTSGSVRDEDGQPPHLLGRRNFLHLTAGAAALPAVSRVAAAQGYPSRPVRLVVGFAAGSTTDILARLIGQWLSERLGQQFVIENRPGAAGNIAAETVVKAPADGYTLLMVPPASAINATLYDKLSFNFLGDMAPVAGVVRVPNVLEVNPSLPVKTVPELIDYAKANPGSLSFASAGIGTASHLAGELFKVMTGAQLVHVAYRGDGPAMTDLIGGQVQVGFATMTASIQHIRADRLRALAVTTATRSQALPDIPTVADFIPGYEASSWFGIAAPRRRIRPWRSWMPSTGKPTQASPMPRSWRGSPTWAAWCLRARPPISASSSPTRPQSGPR